MQEDPIQTTWNKGTTHSKAEMSGYPPNRGHAEERLDGIRFYGFCGSVSQALQITSNGGVAIARVAPVKHCGRGVFAQQLADKISWENRSLLVKRELLATVAHHSDS